MRGIHWVFVVLLIVSSSSARADGIPLDVERSSDLQLLSADELLSKAKQLRILIRNFLDENAHSIPNGEIQGKVEGFLTIVDGDFEGRSYEGRAYRTGISLKRAPIEGALAKLEQLRSDVQHSDQIEGCAKGLHFFLEELLGKSQNPSSDWFFNFISTVTEFRNVMDELDLAVKDDRQEQQFQRLEDWGLNTILIHGYVVDDFTVEVVPTVNDWGRKKFTVKINGIICSDVSRMAWGYMGFEIGLRYGIFSRPSSAIRVLL